MVVGSWQGLFVPKNTPKAVVSKLYQVGQTAMKNATVIKRRGDSCVAVVSSSSSEEFVKFIQAETNRFGKVIRDSKIPTE